jgi:hypothetical protein
MPKKKLMQFVCTSERTFALTSAEWCILQESCSTQNKCVCCHADLSFLFTLYYEMLFKAFAVPNPYQMGTSSNKGVEEFGYKIVM